jgi:RNA-splicing ligase RtcB
MMDAARKYQIELPDPQLCHARSLRQKNRYLEAMASAANFALPTADDYPLGAETLSSFYG